MVIDSWLSMAKKRIDSLDAELIALQCFGPKNADRSWLVSHNVVEITTEMQKKADEMLDRRAKGEPLAYILGFREFYGRNFEVRRGVLIPRPETEGLIELIKGLNLPKRAQFLEIGTGSGCIAVTLALEFPQSTVWASDISRKALEVARRNDRRYEGRVKLMQSNLLADIEFGGGGKYFHVIVANLPYVNKDWRWVDKQNLQFEPRSAIYARGENGLSLYRRMFRELDALINMEETVGVEFVVVEADPCQHMALREIAEKYDLRFLKSEGYGMVFEHRIKCNWWNACTGFPD